MLTVVAVNLVGDALRDELDPRLTLAGERVGPPGP
jgi:ABC-type dipeptide/oligopeptide/nickel transport system permease subunit